MDHRRIGMAISARLRLLGGVILPAAVAIGSVAADQNVAPAAAPQSRSPLARGPVSDLNLVFTAQVVGWIEPCG